MDFESKILDLFIELPEPPTEGQNFSHATTVGKQIYVGGVLPFAEGKIQHPGRVGHEVRLDSAKFAAKTAATLMLAMLKKEVGSLNKVKRLIKLDVYVNCGVEFRDHNKIADSAGEFFASIFGAAAKHVRCVFGVTSLPQNACVQLSAIFDVK